MNFNPSKCQVMHVTRLKTPISSKYFLHNIELESVSAAKYLGVTLSEELRFGKYKHHVTKRQINPLASSNATLKHMTKI